MAHGVSAATDPAILYATLLERERELYTANRLVAEARREIEVLTTERDNALLRIDQLEARVNELEEMPDSEVGRAIVADWNDARGGVNPNA